MLSSCCYVVSRPCHLIGERLGIRLAVTYSWGQLTQVTLREPSEHGSGNSAI